MFQIDKSLDEIIKENKDIKKNVRRNSSTASTKNFNRSGRSVKKTKRGSGDRTNLTNNAKGNAMKIGKRTPSFRKLNNVKLQKAGAQRRSKRLLNSRRSSKFWIKDKIPQVGKWQNDMYDGPNRRSKDGNANIYAMIYPARLVVSNLDPGVTDSDIEELFSEFGPMKGASVHYDRFGRSLETADVVFHDEKHAFNAVDRYNGVPLDGKPMNIEISTANPIFLEPRARSKSPFPKRGKSPFNMNRSRSKSPFAGQRNRDKGWSRPTSRRSRSVSRFRKNRGGRQVGLGKNGEKITIKPFEKSATKEDLDRQLSEYMK